MSKINLIEIITNVADDFRQDLKNQNKKINISIKKKILSKNGHYILGIENRLEQVIANPCADEDLVDAASVEERVNNIDGRYSQDDKDNTRIMQQDNNYNIC